MLIPLPKVAFFMSYFGRPEYTKQTIDSILDAQEYHNVDFFFVDDNNPNMGLRNRIIDFFDNVRDKEYNVLIKMDSDCLVPKNYVTDMVTALLNSDADILSPNVIPSNAAFTYGKEDVDNKGYRPAEIVGGLWCMRADIIKDMYFERHPTEGLTGAISILKQIATEKDPKIGWLPNIVVEDVGHWSGKHSKHIKSKEHEIYSKTVGRQIAWSVK